MAAFTEVGARLGLDVTPFEQGLAKSSSRLTKFGRDAERVLNRKFGFGDAMKGLLQGVGIGSVDAIADAVARPFSIAAERAQTLLGFTERMRDVTKNEIAALNGPAASLRMMKREAKDINVEIGIQKKLIEDLKANPLTFMTSDGTRMLMEAEKELASLQARQAEIPSQIKITETLYLRQAGQIARNALAADAVAKAELRHANEIEKLEIQRQHLVRERKIMEKRDASRPELAQNAAQQLAIEGQIAISRKRQNEAKEDIERRIALTRKLEHMELTHASDVEKHQAQLSGLREEYEVMRKRGATDAQLLENVLAQRQVQAAIRQTNMREIERVREVERDARLQNKLARIELRNGSEIEKQQARLNHLREIYNELRRKKAPESAIAANRAEQDALKGQIAVTTKAARETRDRSAVSLGEVAAAGRTFRNGAPRPRSELERIAQRGQLYAQRADDALLTGKPQAARDYTVMARKDLTSVGERIAKTSELIPKEDARAVSTQLISAAQDLKTAAAAVNDAFRSIPVQ